MSCCASNWRDDADRAPVRGAEKPMIILHHQPRLIPAPLYENRETEPSTRASSREWVARTRSFASRASSRGSFSVRRKLNAYNGLRRPRIGAPTDFRHVDNAMPRRADRPFRPLELSIYLPENQLSPILPHFGAAEDDRVLSFPSATFTHKRSQSALSSFSVPRKPLNAHNSFAGRLERSAASIHTTPSSIGSEFVAHPLRPRPSLPESPSTQELMAALQKALPRLPPQARLRANTEPLEMFHRRDSEQIERVKSIMLEKFELERRLKDIDSVIQERRSIYMSSRPGSAYAESEEPMPDLKTSELERMPFPSRPRTAPSKSIHIPVRAKSFIEASAAFNPTADLTNRAPPPPPLPLVLQTSHPPLRKKKSFSRVSNWLFPGAEHTRNISLDSVTNQPKPITSREGFYQCVDPTARFSSSSVTTVSTLESEIDEPTLPTTWTPESSPGRAPKMDKSMELTRMATFGVRERKLPRKFEVVEQIQLPQRLSSVGVAF